MQMDKKHVFHPRDPKTLTRKQLKAVIRSSIFLKEKYLPSGEFEKLKARLVAGGHMQDKSLYEDISSPTVSTSAVFAVAAIAAKEKRHVVTLDIGGAYLNVCNCVELRGEFSPSNHVTQLCCIIPCALTSPSVFTLMIV